MHEGFGAHLLYPGVDPGYSVGAKISRKVHDIDINLVREGGAQTSPDPPIVNRFAQISVDSHVM